jgi:hypothetical protein
MKTQLPSLPFAQATASRIQSFADRLHGLYTVRATANPDCTVSVHVEYFANDATRDGSGDADTLRNYFADLGLEAFTESPAEGRPSIAGQAVEIYTLG